MRFGLILIVTLFISACRPSFVSDRFTPPQINGAFESTLLPLPPDYSKDEAWCALPWKHDFADSVPNTSLKNNQDVALADVFFVHPTTYTSETAEPSAWNASISDEKLNFITDSRAILNQATAFNGSCRVFAPRYRQAHIYSFYTPDKVSGDAAVELAYQDVKSAFEHYITYFNKGRPFIIASHSQGTIHAGRLLKEIIEPTELITKFIAAYLVGIPVPQDYFVSIQPCNEPGMNQCFASWCTFAEGYIPPNYAKSGYENAVCINPLSWQTNDSLVSRNKNQGGITWNYNQVKPGLNNARVHKGLLWIEKPRVPGKRLINMKNYHIADYNLFWMNIRNNVQLQVTNYFTRLTN